MSFAEEGVCDEKGHGQIHSHFSNCCYGGRSQEKCKKVEAVQKRMKLADLKSVLVSSTKIIFLVLCVLFVPVSKATVAEATAAEDITAISPQIQIDEPVFDFGSVYEGEEVTHTFKFKNVGSAILKVSKARTTCGDFSTDIFWGYLHPLERHFGKEHGINKASDINPLFYLCYILDNNIYYLSS